MRARMSARARKDRPVGREAGNYVEKRVGGRGRKPGLHRGAFASPSLLPPAPHEDPRWSARLWLFQAPTRIFGGGGGGGGGGGEAGAGPRILQAGRRAKAGLRGSPDSRVKSETEGDRKAVAICAAGVNVEIVRDAV